MKNYVLPLVRADLATVACGLAVCVAFADEAPAPGICGARGNLAAVGRHVACHARVSSNGIDATVLVPSDCPGEAYAVLWAKRRRRLANWFSMLSTAWVSRAQWTNSGTSLASQMFR